MNFNYRVPGVYREELVIAPAPRLPTGVPGFVGFAEPRAGRAGQAAFYRPVALRREGEFEAEFTPAPGSYLAAVLTGFFLNGGVRCYVSCAAPGGDPGANLLTALESLSAVGDLDLVAAPDAMALGREPGGEPDAAAALRVQRELLRHCETHGGRLAILDALPGQDVAGVKAQRDRLALGLNEPLNGALYYPWLRVAGGGVGAVGNVGGPAPVPPCGHVAGTFARSDARAGVFKSPANEELMGVLDLETVVDSSVQGELNPEGINCLRAFPGRGIRVWGARTVSRDPAWRYVGVRRLFLTLHRWVEANMAWTAFEPNTPRLWVRLRRELSVHLYELWQAGALAGQTAKEAFYVKCDAETNPPEARDAGLAVAEVGLAPSAPAEFVVVRITRRVGAEPR
jgi:phage tail sheath protein FI